MNIELLDSIRKHEGYRAKVYKDTLGYDTIGYGFAIKDLELDEDICAIILRRKLESLIRTVNFKYGWFKSMPDEVQNVIIEMCYQLGVSGFGKFVKTIGYLQTFQFEKAADEMLDSRWAKQTPNRAKALSDIVRCA